MRGVKYLVDGTCYMSDVDSVRRYCYDETHMTLQLRSNGWVTVYSANGYAVAVWRGDLPDKLWPVTDHPRMVTLLKEQHAGLVSGCAKMWRAAAEKAGAVQLEC